MAEGAGHETASLGHFVRRHNSYGSTTKSRNACEMFIKHTVSPSDTLQGLALKYGVTMEQIKRANKIWTNDSLFLRASLNIPVTQSGDILFLAANGDQASTSSNDLSELCHKSSRTNSSPEIQLTNSSSIQSCVHYSLDENTDYTVTDFLDKIDKSIAETRCNVEKLEANNTFPDIDLPRFTPKPRKPSRARSHSDDSSSPPHPIVMTQGKRVQTSRERMERVQDDIFEL